MSNRTLDSSNIPTMLAHIGPIAVKGWAVYGCECGWLGRKRTNDVNQGKIRSCGCLRRRLVGERSVTHKHSLGRTPTTTYGSWYAMKARCSNPSNTHWKNYGGRGINFCVRWRKFKNFLADMGERPDGHTLDRKDNNKGYNPKNCRWATTTEQAFNSPRSIRLVHRDRTYTTHALAAYAGLSYSNLMNRLHTLGWTVAQAVETPVGGKK